MNSELPAEALPQVLYIMGTARSGSTILDIMLGHGEHCVATGELALIVQDGFIENKKCSCGQHFDACRFWSRIREEIDLSPSELAEWAAIQRKFDWHSGFFFNLMTAFRQQEKILYQRYNSALLLAIQHISHRKVIVDSSKYSGRALALSRIPGINLRVICLTRSPEGILSSFKKTNCDEQLPKSTLGSMVYYCAVLTMLRISCWVLPQTVLQIKYEELLSNPEKTLKKIERSSNINLKKVKQKIHQNTDFNTGHIVTGNRLRHQEKVQFQAVNALPTGLGWTSRTSIGLMRAWQRVMRFQ